MLNAPVAFVFFNRPEATKVGFERIRKARPSKLFLIGDAARRDHPGEEDRVRRCRSIAQQVDWNCEVQTIFAEQNMGCGRRIASGITRAMKEVDRLIVLEDDCVANPSFFDYCDELLERYSDDERVMAISGDNFQQGVRRTRASYYFSKYPHCWGWATWRRAWQHFRLDIPDWPEFRDSGHLAGICSSRRELEYWTRIFDEVHQGNIDSWAYPWALCCWMHHGLTALPAVNLVSNTGFGEDATHTRRKNPIANLPTESLDKILHPASFARHFAADNFTDELIFSGFGRRRSPLRRIGQALRSRSRAA